MALESNRTMPLINVDSVEVTKPVQLHSFWTKVHEDSKTADDSTLNDPEDDITSDKSRLFFAPLGTSLVLCHGYTGSVGSVSTQPVVKVFGRTVATSDEVDPDAHVVDLLGCNQILVGIKTAAAGNTTGFILGKMI